LRLDPVNHQTQPLGKGLPSLAAPALVVERTFGWLNRFRRLAKDDERTPDSSAAHVQIAMIRLMLARLARRTAPSQPKTSQEAVRLLSAA
jgi:hypothetical protein